MAPSMIWTFFVDLNSSPAGGACPGSITVGLVIFTWDEHMGRSVAASGKLLRRPPVNGHHITAQDVSTVNEHLSSAINTARSNPDKEGGVGASNPGAQLACVAYGDEHPSAIRAEV